MRRLFDDPQLSAELRDDLLRSRAAGRHYDTLDKLPQLRAALSDAGRQPLEADPPGTTPPAQGWSLWHSVPAGWKLAAIVLAFGTSAAWLARPQPHADEAPAPPPPLVAAPASPPPAAEPVPPPAEAVLPPPAAAPSEVAKTAPAPAGSSSRREIEQLVRIRTLLAQNPAAAYKLARRSEQEFPRGLLSEERQALQVVALARSGDTAGALRQEREFLGRYPQSSLRPLIDSALHH